jgi:hypothetical protein
MQGEGISAGLTHQFQMSRMIVACALLEGL